MGWVGRVLVGVGVLLLLFVAYQLWGTNLAEARSQQALRRAFDRSLTNTTTALVLPSSSPASTTTTEAPAPPPVGEAVAVLRIPAIGVDKAVIEGVGVPDLKKGPGHYPTTPMPGQPGNAAIAAHRTTYGAPFYRLDQLEVGDDILVTTRQGRFRYEVDGSRIVEPGQTEVLDQGEGARLTLTTCNPRFSARQRLVVTAVLKGEPAPAPPPTTTPPGQAATVAFETPSLSGDRSAAAPTAFWGFLAAFVGLLTWLAARRWRKLPAYLLGGAAFLVVLFVFFENISRLLPANI
ncbi:MAG: sortase family protein LPXTG-site transpeptidase [Acidimicrobiales bacterium]|nr:sortase family protein LPXTG-site transpeptidase [Acidimicrobiales bacterium]